MKQLLQKLEQMVGELESNSSSLNKIKVLQEYLPNDDALALLVWYTHNDFVKYNVTSKNSLKLASKLVADNIDETSSVSEFMWFLDAMADAELTGHAAVSRLLGWCKAFPAHEDTIYRLVDKDLKCRVSVKAINKVMGDNWVPEFKVALAEKYVAQKDTITEEWFVSHKLDGVRCLCVYDNGNITFNSRTGNLFNTLGNINDEIHQLAHDSGLKQFVLDGEICLVVTDEHGNDVEDFQSVMKVIRKKDYTIENPKYKIFDFLTLEEFTEATSTEILSERLDKLQEIMDDIPYERLEKLEQIKCTSENLAVMQDKADKFNWEGLIVRKNTVYKGKRSRDMLKLKKFMDAEYVVNDVLLGQMNIVKDGAEKTIDALTAVFIEHKGHKVKVGSGFSMDERQEYFKNPAGIIGKTINVQYFEETTNEKGGISLRFPTKKFIYENGRDT